MLVAASLLERVRACLGGAEGVRKVVVFGSWARGDARPDSDLDLMVVADVQGSLAQRSYEIRRRLVDIEVPIDLVVYTPAEYARFRRWRSSVASIADREGVLLHG
jgi:predicted nucleotidyltransferase